MAKSHWLINPNRTEVKRFIKNDKSIDWVFEYMFVDTGKIVGIFGKEKPIMTTTVFCRYRVSKRNLWKINFSGRA